MSKYLICDEYWVKKCMEFRVEDKILFGRPRRRAWLESVESVSDMPHHMPELEIDKEDVHHRKKWRRNVMKIQRFNITYIFTVTCSISLIFICIATVMFTMQK